MITLSTRGARSARCASLLAIALAGTCCRVTWAQEAPSTQAPAPRPDAIVYRVQSATQRLELIVNSSRILTLDKKITQAQVSNTDILDITPLSATQVQISAKKAGVTQVNLWDPEGKIHAIDVIVFGDARELEMILRSEFPTTALKAVPLANSVVISGHVDDPNQISRIIAIAQDFYPNVIDNITVGGVQQVMLKVKVLEVSRTKLRRLGTDFQLQFGEDFVQSSISGIIQGVAAGAGSATTANDTVAFGIFSGNDSFQFFLEALRQNNVAKILAEPNLVTYSGRPASFIVGGEFPILVPQSLGTVSIQYKKFGTQIDFVPLVLGNNAIRLEVRPRVSEIDDTRSVVTQGINVPALKLREANTGVEMQAGQTFALAGLVQSRVDASTRGWPFLSDVPWLGVAFRRNREEINEVELLILCTPYFVEPMNPDQVPCGGPGLNTASPNDVQFYFRGHIEVPRCPDDDACAPFRSPGTAFEGTDAVGGWGIGVDGGEMIAPGAVAPNGAPTVAPNGNHNGQEAPPPAPDPSGAARWQGSAPTASLGRPASSPVRLWAPSAAKQERSGSPEGSVQTPVRTAAATDEPPGFIGSIGYDVRKK